MKNRRKSLSEAMGYRKRPRKMTLNELRGLIETQLLFEKEEEKKEKEKEVDETVPEQFRNPKMTSTPADGKGNIKVLLAR